MGSTQSPMAIDDHGDDDALLPSYLARHTALGFDADDIAALISSIDSSEIRTSQSSASSLPHLPAEIVLHVLDYVPINYVLEWRLVCRGFRDAIDGPVMYDYLQRAELIGYIGPHLETLEPLSEAEYEKLHLLRVRFLHMADERTWSPMEEPRRSGPKWACNYAIFGNDNGWRHDMEQCMVPFAQLDEAIRFRLEPCAVEEYYGALKWCVRLDEAVLDVEVMIQARKMFVDFVFVEVHAYWKDLLFGLLKTETMLRKKMDEKRGSAFTYSFSEDCLRAVRRQRFRSVLDPSDRSDRQLSWAMDLMHPLFGKIQYDRASEPWDGLERAEDDAMIILMILRREACMNAKEVAYLTQLARDRAAMVEELKAISELFSKWKKNLYSTKAFHSSFMETMPTVALNPLFWSDEIIREEAERVRKWQSQKRMIEQVVTLLEASNEVLELSEDAFDDVGSEV
ncbi:hypothetical protein K505DRAFT_415529 [Melanomma pulvis-pyrius CBS 109.77]|uniref:F-box domain-containing protein n=1 Tax=Melanomma pulvis-pyrius CBS 109.77 TaxID=1314802 RepID=A0A6A6XJM8_9PLEO|nr:hypothetical protein K505DRAFT_415529 [Melanomma pulvis-pyrius CBS 109.77]